MQQPCSNAYCVSQLLFEGADVVIWALFATDLLFKGTPSKVAQEMLNIPHPLKRWTPAPTCCRACRIRRLQLWRAHCPKGCFWSLCFECLMVMIRCCHQKGKVVRRMFSSLAPTTTLTLAGTLTASAQEETTSPEGTGPETTVDEPRVEAQQASGLPGPEASEGCQGRRKASS